VPTAHLLDARLVAPVHAGVSPGTQLDRLLVLVIALAVLLGIAGGVGLYLTRRRS
jgi:hypothetical protein